MGKPRTGRTAEYRLSFARTRDERDDSVKTLFLLETVRQFAAFRYEISVREEIEDREIRLAILGLKAPDLGLPAAGPAEFRRAYALEGEYTVSVRGLDGTVVAFPLQVRGGVPSVRRLPEPSFLEVIAPTS